MRFALFFLAAPFALAACAGAPQTKLAGAPGAARPGSPTAVDLAKTDVPEKPAAAEAKLLARIEQLTAEPELFQRNGGARRPQIAPRTFQLKDLPVAHVSAPLTAADPPLGLLGKSEIATELSLTPLASQGGGTQRATTVSFKEKTFGEVLVGDWQLKNLSFNRTTGNPSYISCGTVYPRYQPARWTSLRRIDDDQAELTVSDGWVDGVDCKVWMERRVSVKAKAILPGHVLYAFRDCKGAEDGKRPDGAASGPQSTRAREASPRPQACAGQEALTLVLPNAQSLVANGVGGEVRGQNTAFAMATIPIRKGGGGSIFARLDTFGNNLWRKGFGEPAMTALEDTLVGLGVEVMQGVDDPEPIAIAYVARPAAAQDAISGL